MKNSQVANSSTTLNIHFAVYSVPQAAVLWCGVPEKLVDRIVLEAERVESIDCPFVWKHPDVEGLEFTSRAILEAVKDYSLPTTDLRDSKTMVKTRYGELKGGHIYRRKLKEWMIKAFPHEKPAFLFDDDERETYAVETKVFQMLLKEKDDVEKQLARVTQANKILCEKNKSLKAKCDSLKAVIENTDEPGERSKTTYLNIIAVLLCYIKGEVQDIGPHPSFISEAKLIEAIVESFPNVDGLSSSTLQHKFPQAKQSFKARHSQ